MLKFFKDSARELKHVVWPTGEETKKYFTIVVTVLVLFGTYLFIASTVFSEVLFGLKDATSSSATPSVEVTEPIKVETTTATGTEVNAEEATTEAAE
jgi:preprotein translocase SecE subunit